MKPKSLNLLIGVTSSISFFAVTLFVTNNTNIVSYKNVISSGSPYTLTLDNNNHLTDDVSPNLSVSDADVETASGNTLSFKYLYGYNSGSGFITLNESGELTSESSVMGISSITVTSSSSLKLEYAGNLVNITSGEKRLISSNSFSLISYVDNNVISSIVIEYTCSNSVYTYTDNGDTYQLTAINDKTLTSYDIPLKYMGKTVTVDKGVFEGCTYMESISIPSLDGHALGYFFKTGDQSTKYVDIAGYLPSSLRKVTIKSGTIPDNALRECSNLTDVTFLHVTILGQYTLYNTTNLVNVFFNDGITSMGKNNFNAATSLVDVYIPITVTALGADQFTSCSNLTSIRCAAASKPAGWNASWYGSYEAMVSWGQSR